MSEIKINQNNQEQASQTEATPLVYVARLREADEGGLDDRTEFKASVDFGDDGRLTERKLTNREFFKAVANRLNDQKDREKRVTVELDYESLPEEVQKINAEEYENKKNNRGKVDMYHALVVNGATQEEFDKASIELIKEIEQSTVPPTVRL